MIINLDPPCVFKQGERLRLFRASSFLITWFYTRFLLLTQTCIKKTFIVVINRFDFLTLARQGEGWDPINRFNPTTFYEPVPSQDSSHCVSCVFSPFLFYICICVQRGVLLRCYYTLFYTGANCSLPSGVVFYCSLKTIGWPWVAAFISGRRVVSWMCSPILSFILW